MPESLRNAGQALLRFLKDLPARSRVAGAAFVAWLRPRLVGLRAVGTTFVAWSKPRLVELREAGAASWDRLRAAVQRGLEGLPGRIEAARRRSAELLHRLAGAVAPVEVEAEVEAEPAPLSSDTEFMAMLGDLGAVATPRAQGTDTTLKDAEIAALRAELNNLRGLGDRLASTELERLELAQRVAELEGHGDAANAARVSRAREQLDRHRAEAADWKRKAAERWHELRALRSRVKELEQALAQSPGAKPLGPLPERGAASARRTTRTRRPTS